MKPTPARVGRPKVSLAKRLASRIRTDFPEVSQEQGWPSKRFEGDPVAFAYYVLGIKCWDRQEELLRLAVSSDRVACASGHKVSKSTSAAILALYHWTLHEDVRVILTAPTSRQIRQIIWREIKKLHARSGRCYDCVQNDPRGPRPCPHSEPLDGFPAELPASGLVAGFREILGFTARDAEAVAGISGPNLIYVVDEASGVGEDIYEAIEGNRAGGASIFLISNPTRTEGEFFEAFHGKSEFYQTMSISSEETPNVKQGRRVIPGLAQREYIEEKRKEWGEDSPIYKVRILGQFPKNEDGKIISLHEIVTAEERWAETKAEGRLFIGIDPAGDKGDNDESAFAVRRGNKMLHLGAHRGMTANAHLSMALQLIRQFNGEGEASPVITLDGEGPVGYEVWSEFKGWLNKRSRRRNGEPSFELIRFRGARFWKNPDRLYDRDRDLIWRKLRDWIREGGAILGDTKLQQELHAPSWYEDENGRLKVTSKKNLLKIIGRSPDRADALSLAIWEPKWIREQTEEGPSEQIESGHGTDAEQMLDAEGAFGEIPRASLEFWRQH